MDNTKSVALLSLLRVRTADRDLAKLLEVAVDSVDNLVQPELISIYLCDHSKNEIFICASKDGMEGLVNHPFDA